MDASGDRAILYAYRYSMSPSDYLIVSLAVIFGGLFISRLVCGQRNRLLTTSLVIFLFFFFLPPIHFGSFFFFREIETNEPPITQCFSWLGRYSYLLVRVPFRTTRIWDLDTFRHGRVEETSQVMICYQVVQRPKRREVDRSRSPDDV